MLLRRPETITKTVVRPKRTPYQNYTKSIADILHDPFMNSDTKVQTLKVLTAPYLETETMEVTTRRMA